MLPCSPLVGPLEHECRGGRILELDFFWGARKVGVGFHRAYSVAAWVSLKFLSKLRTIRSIAHFRPEKTLLKGRQQVPLLESLVVFVPELCA